jgi:hypothetical protein
MLGWSRRGYDPDRTSYSTQARYPPRQPQTCETSPALRRLSTTPSPSKRNPHTTIPAASRFTPACKPSSPTSALLLSVGGEIRRRSRAEAQGEHRFLIAPFHVERRPVVDRAIAQAARALLATAHQNDLSAASSSFRGRSGWSFGYSCTDTLYIARGQTPRRRSRGSLSPGCQGPLRRSASSHSGGRALRLQRRAPKSRLCERAPCIDHQRSCCCALYLVKGKYDASGWVVA